MGRENRVRLVTEVAHGRALIVFEKAEVGQPGRHGLEGDAEQGSQGLRVLQATRPVVFDPPPGHQHAGGEVVRNVLDLLVPFAGTALAQAAIRGCLERPIEHVLGLVHEGEAAPADIVVLVTTIK